MDKQQQVMELWRRHFQDSEAFVQFYFSRKYDDRHVSVHEENGKILSAFLMLPYPMNWQGISLKTSYISGASTLQEVRNHGYMTRLLKKALTGMHQKDIALSTLIPAEEWLFDYYGKLGYVTVFDYSAEKYETKHAQNTSEQIFSVYCPHRFDPNFAKSVFPYFERKMKARHCCIQHPPEDYLSVIEEAYLSGGRLAIAYVDTPALPQGWALAVPEQDCIQIKECFYDSPQEQKFLFQYFSTLWPDTPIEYRTLPQGKHTRHYGMARITNAGIMLQQIAQKHPDLSISLTLHDPNLPVQAGTYIISQGMCVKKEQRQTQTDIETDVPTLTRALLGYHPEELPRELATLTDKQVPFMNLMMD